MSMEPQTPLSRTKGKLAGRLWACDKDETSSLARLWACGMFDKPKSSHGGTNWFCDRWDAPLVVVIPTDVKDKLSIKGYSMVTKTIEGKPQLTSKIKVSKEGEEPIEK